MSLFSIPARKHTTYYDHLMSSTSSKTPARDRLNEHKKASVHHLSTESVHSTCDESRSSVYRSREVNRTYVISASLSKPPAAAAATPTRGRLTLQRRRKTNAENSELTTTTMSENAEKTQTTAADAPEKRLTLQRRTRAGTGTGTDPGTTTTGSRQNKVLSESNSMKAPTGGVVVLRSASLRDTVSKYKAKEAPLSTPAAEAAEAPERAPSMRPLEDLKGKTADQSRIFSTPTKKTLFERIASKKEVFEKLSAKGPAPRVVSVKSVSLERPRIIRRLQAEDTKPVPAPRGTKTPSSGGVKSNASLPPAAQARKTSTQDTSTPSQVPSPPTQVSAQPLVRLSEVLEQQDSLKMENSAVTVAVRVRPFNARFVNIQLWK